MKRSPRNLLLPTWIRFFSWLFLVVGLGAACAGLLGALIGSEGRMQLFGLNYLGPLRHTTPMLISLIFAVEGYAAFALLWRRSNGRILGLVAGYLGLGICVFVIVMSLQHHRFYLPLEPLFQIPFVVTLHKLRGRWEEEPEPPLEPAAATSMQAPLEP